MRGRDSLGLSLRVLTTSVIVPARPHPKRAPPSPEGKGPLGESKRIASLVAGAPADVKAAAEALLKAVNEASAQGAKAVHAASQKAHADLAKAAADALRTLGASALAAKLAAVDPSGDALGPHGESSANAG